MYCMDCKQREEECKCLKHYAPTKKTGFNKCPDCGAPPSIYCNCGRDRLNDALASKEKALRYNEGKLKWELLPVEWTKELVKIFTKGAEKYAPNNWKQSINTDDSESFRNDRLGSAFRHISEWQMGQAYDNETSCHHLAMAAWNLLAIFYYEVKENVTRKDNSKA